MLIYTQDRHRIVKFKDILDLFISYGDEPIIYCSTNDNPFNEDELSYGIVLGRYENKERCKEVLEEIAVQYSNLEIFKLFTKNRKYICNESFVYYMPEE